MFIGHYGIAYFAEKKSKTLPLWLLFIAVQLPDFISFLLVILGIERASYTPSDNPFFRNQLFLPYSHSLISVVILSLLIYFIFRIVKDNSRATILSLCVLSHWVIDFIVHTSDLPLLFGSINTGLGLWNYPYFSYSMEIVILLTGWLLFAEKNIYSYLLLAILILGFSGMVFSEEPEAMKSSSTLRTLIVFITNIIYLLLAFISSRKKSIIAI